MLSALCALALRHAPQSEFYMHNFFHDTVTDLNSSHQHQQVERQLLCLLFRMLLILRIEEPNMRLQKHELLVPKEAWSVRAFLRFCKSYPACSVRLSHFGLFTLSIKYNWLRRWNECGNKSLKWILEYNSIGISTKFDRKRVRTRWNGLFEGCIITNTGKCSMIRIIQLDADSKLNTVSMMAT